METALWLAAVIKKRFTADEYQRMGQVGILSDRDRVELIDGEVVAMTPIGRTPQCVRESRHSRAGTGSRRRRHRPVTGLGALGSLS